MAKHYTALTIAKWFIAYAEANDADRSMLKVQKLLYYAQGHHLGQGKGLLFDDPIQAWDHGPVVPSVYHVFKGKGSRDLDLVPEDDFEFHKVDTATSDFLIAVWEAYAQFSPWKLRNMTHEPGPWTETFNGAKHQVIPARAMEEFFAV